MVVTWVEWMVPWHEAYFKGGSNHVHRKCLDSEESADASRLRGHVLTRRFQLVGLKKKVNAKRSRKVADTSEKKGRSQPMRQMVSTDLRGPIVASSRIMNAQKMRQWPTRDMCDSGVVVVRGSARIAFASLAISTKTTLPQTFHAYEGRLPSACLRRTPGQNAHCIVGRELQN